MYAMSQGKVTLLLSLSLICFAFFQYVSGKDSASALTASDTDGSGSGDDSMVTTMSMASTSSSEMKGESTSSSTTPDPSLTSMMSTTTIQSSTVSPADSVAVMATPLATSPTLPEDASSVLELIEENWTALVIGLGIGLLVGCCGCCPPLICLFRRRKRDVYVLESEKKKPHVRFQEKTSVRVEEIPLESADNDKDASKEGDTSGEGKSEPTLTKDEKPQSPSDVVVMATADVAKETETKDKEVKKVNLSKEDSASKETSDSKRAAPSDTTLSTVKDDSPSKNKDKGKKTSSETQSKNSSPPKGSTSSTNGDKAPPTDKDKATSDVKGMTPSLDTHEKAEDLHAKQTGLGGTSLTKTPPTDENAKAATNVKEEKTVHTPTPEKGSQQQTDTSLKQGNASSSEGTTSGATQGEKAAKLEQQQPKKSKDVPGGDEIDALLKDVLNWEIHS